MHQIGPQPADAEGQPRPCPDQIAPPRTAGDHSFDHHVGSIKDRFEFTSPLQNKQDDPDPACLQLGKQLRQVTFCAADPKTFGNDEYAR